MAKRRKEKDEAEEVDFKIPKFDEEAFVKKEREKIRATVISFLFGIIIAIISFGFWVLLTDSPFQWTLVFLFGFFNGSWLRYIFSRFNVDESDLERKGQFASYAIYFLTWLFVLIVLVNPPFYDDEAPVIDMVTLPGMQEPGGSVKIVALVTDNAGIMDNQVQFQLMHNDSVIQDETVMLEDSIFLYEFLNPGNLSGSFSFSLQTEDTSGYSTEETGSFTYSEDVIRVPEPQGANSPPGARVTYTTDIKIDIEPEVDWVYYYIDNILINVTKDEQFYVTSPIYNGWDQDAEMEMTVYAQDIHYFQNIPTRFNNTIQDTSTYYFNVSDANEIGSEDDPSIQLPGPRFVQVPGFELVAALIALAGIAFILRQKKKQKKQ